MASIVMLGFPTRIASISNGERCDVISMDENKRRGVHGIHGISSNFSVNARGTALLWNFLKAPHLAERRSKQTFSARTDRF